MLGTPQRTTSQPEPDEREDARETQEKQDRARASWMLTSRSTVR